jgi:hypothetical protein
MINFAVILCFLFSLSPLQSYALDQFQTESGAQKHCPRDVVVWLNFHTGRYHYNGQQWYGKTKVGAFVCKQEMLNDGDRVKRKADEKSVPQDYKEALKRYRLSAEQGDANSQYSLGVMYDLGQGVLQDYQEASKWYRLSAEQGNANAQWSLGAMYRDGLGVLQDYQEASKWYRLSAEQGDAYSQSSLGAMYRDGLGFAQDFVLAYMWFNIAAANANNSEQQKRYIDSRNIVEERLSAQQLAKAQELARKCTAKNYKGC